MNSTSTEHVNPSSTTPEAIPTEAVDPQLVFQLLAALQQQVIQQNLLQTLLQGQNLPVPSLTPSPISLDDSTRSSSAAQSSTAKMDSTPAEVANIPTLFGNINTMLQFFGTMNQMPFNYEQMATSSVQTPPTNEEPTVSVSPTHKMRRTRTPTGPYRVPYTNEQLKVLETSFAADRFAFGETKERLVRMTGLSHRQIKVWFQNRRAQDRRKGRASSKTPESSEDSEAGDNGHESNCHVSWNHQFGLQVVKEEKTEEQELEDVEIDIIN